MTMTILRPLLVIAILAGVGLRTSQLLLFFDESTGFLTDSGIFAPALIVLCLLTALAAAFTAGQNDLTRPQNKPSVLSGILAVVLCGGCFASAVWDLRVLTDPSVLVNLLAPVSLLVSDLLLGISMGSAAVCHFRGMDLFAGARGLVVFPVLSMCARAVFLFALCTPRDTMFVNFLNLSTLLLLVLFFCAYGYQFTDEAVQPPSPSLLVCGAAGSMLGLIASVPHIVCFVLGKACLSSANLPHHLMMTAVSLYVLVYTLEIHGEKAEPSGRRYRA